jgi:tRNA(fMet)-specific endonuclease VapC
VIILDTDHCVEVLRGNKRVVAARMKRPEAVAVTWMTVGELYYGAAKSKDPYGNFSLVDAFLLTVEIMFPTIKSMRLFGEVKARLSKEGSNLADADLLIAAAALETGSVLVTGNIRHFERVPGVKLENWTK